MLFHDAINPGPSRGQTMEIMMKMLFASVAAVAALAAAAPAAAQSFSFSFGSHARVSPAAQIDQRIDFGLRSGALRPHEARQLRARLYQVQQLEWRYARNGRISPQQARDLDRRYAQVEARVIAEMRNHRGPPMRYGWGYGQGQGYYR